MRISRLMAIGICAGLAVASVTAGQKRIIPRETPSNAPFSPAVVAGDFIYLSGTLARGDGIQAQAKAVLDTLGNVLERAGASFDRVAAVTVYLKNPSDFQGMNEVFRTYWPTDPPTRTTVQANLVREDALIEISMVAIRPGAERQVIHPEGWPSNAAPYSYGIKSGDTVFLAGIVGRKYREGANVDGDIQVETRSIFDNARQILDAAGMSLAEVVSSRVYITDTSMFGDMNTAYREHFPDMPPARATVRAGLMGSRYHLEITMVAVSGERERIIRPNVDGSPGRPSATLSHAVRVGNRLYVSGMLGVNDDTRGDTTAQARAALASIGRTLEAADFGWGDLVDGVVYLTDMGNWADMNVAYREVITEDFPARAAVGTGLMNADGLVEIMFTAAK